MGLTRRDFVKRMGAAALAVGGLPRLPKPGASPRAIAVIGSGEDTPYARGALLGIEEGGRLATLLRRPPPLLRLPAPSPPAAADLVRDLAARDCVAVVFALPQEDHEALELKAVEAGLVVLDARAIRPDVGARPGVFRTGLPAGAHAGILARSAAPAADTSADRRVVLWHDGLFRYGAEQLNERYRRRFGSGMNGEAWAAWMAVKAGAEALLRGGEGGSAGLVKRLGGERAAFDGHKGSALAFTAPGGSLAQPVYVLGSGRTEEVMWPMEESR